MARFGLIVFIFILGINVAVAAGDVSRFVFTTEPQTIKPNEISQKITIQAQDAGGNSSNLAQTACLELKTTSGAGEFSSSDTNWSPVQRLTMSKGSANRNFYYKDSAEGAYELSINVSLRPEEESSSCASWPVENWDIKWNPKQNITVSLSQNNPPPDNPPQGDNRQPTTTEPTGSGASWPTEEQIFANAGEDKIVPVGADAVFSGKALGIKKEPLDNARYSWNFGDGASAQGQNVLHFYKYPGKYIVTLDASSGKYAASDRAIVEAVPNELKIIEANNEFIKLRNGSKYIFDISGWFLKVAKNNPASVKTMAGEQTFQFPKSSLISSGADLVISSDVSKIKAGNNAVELLYPNGSVAFVYEYKINNQQLVVNNQTSSPRPSPLEGEGGERSKSGEAEFVKHSVFDNNKAENTDVEHPMSNMFDIATATDSGRENQLASVIAVADEKDFMKGKWIFLAIALGIFASAGLFFIRRYGGG